MQIPAGNGLFGVVTKNETLKRGSISRVGCEAVLQDKWVTDDGRYILETKGAGVASYALELICTTGRRPFRIVEIVQVTILSIPWLAERTTSVESIPHRYRSDPSRSRSHGGLGWLISSCAAGSFFQQTWTRRSARWSCRAGDLSTTWCGWLQRSSTRDPGFRS
uniref:Uncharacterized protein n=1 Tax=Guillardia theta TaxID=55529 RepID=A0A7S4HB47_GUITH|mmetsp:Transcript_12790/g.44869  ORF Transcript_12790/g.44869 Transcript_12790/m.44869 type:complete len:164 (+) Transcript_12790:68-559(+)